jgi:hypothetical protein
LAQWIGVFPTKRAGSLNPVPYQTGGLHFLSLLDFV